VVILTPNSACPLHASFFYEDIGYSHLGRRGKNITLIVGDRESELLLLIACGTLPNLTSRLKIEIRDIYAFQNPTIIVIAFNSASWHHTLNALCNLNIPIYIQRVVASYISGEVPQGSVLGPLLWNAMYDGILRITMPDEARLIGFVDDVAIVEVAEHLSDAERISKEAGKRQGHGTIPRDSP